MGTMMTLIAKSNAEFRLNPAPEGSKNPDSQRIRTITKFKATAFCTSTRKMLLLLAFVVVCQAGSLRRTGRRRLNPVDPKYTKQQLKELIPKYGGQLPTGCWSWTWKALQKRAIETLWQKLELSGTEWKAWFWQQETRRDRKIDQLEIYLKASERGIIKQASLDADKLRAENASVQKKRTDKLRHLVEVNRLTPNVSWLDAVKKAAATNPLDLSRSARSMETPPLPALGPLPKPVALPALEPLPVGSKLLNWKPASRKEPLTNNRASRLKPVKRLSPPSSKAKAIVARPEAPKVANDNSVTTSSKVTQTRTDFTTVMKTPNPFDVLDLTKPKQSSNAAKKVKKAKKAKKSPVAPPAAANAANAVAFGEVGYSGTIPIGAKKVHFKVLSKDGTKRVLQLRTSTGKDLKPKPNRLEHIRKHLNNGTTRGRVTVPLALLGGRRRLASAEAVLGPLLGESKSLQ